MSINAIPVEKLGFETFLPFSRPTMDKETIAEVVACLESGWITTGPRVAAFEAALADYCQAPHALCVTSATAGLHLVFHALGLEPGDEVITTAMTFVATYNVLVQNGLKPVLVDVDPLTYNMDMNQVREAITPRTKAIMPVHFAGLSVDMEALYKLADEFGLRVVEDAAHAIGTAYQGKKIGSFGDIQVFSFHPNKNMTTGEGGCIITRDDQLAEKMKVLRFHGIDREAWNRFGKAGSQHYEVVAPGFKYNMMDLQAALGLHQLKKLDGFIERRTHLAQRYLQGLKDVQQLQLPAEAPKGDRHAWHLFAPLVKGDRDAFMQRLKDYNVGSGLHYRAPYLYPYYQETFGWKPGDFPVAESIGNHIVSLPLFPTLTEVEQDKVIEVVHAIAGEVA